MPVTLGDGWRARGPIDKWRLPGDPPFATSRAYELLVRDLRRYVREDIAGRSFLIAGHRGAGKTATVAQALRVVRNEIMLGETSRAGKRGRLQRPLLVKLVGESLIAPPPVLKEARKPEDEAAEEKKAEPAAGVAQGDGKEEKEEPHDEVAAALVHLTIALYRALAAEVSEGFAVHALESPEDQRRERLELAGQLALELDGTPEPALLRDYWERLGRLEDGVLWPLAATPALYNSLTFDQGFRELVAVSTAAQAFQVCSGAVTYTVTNQDSATREGTLDSAVDIKDLVNRLGAIGAGAIAGGAVGASAGAAPGIGTGLLVWLLSAATLKWTGKRHHKSSRTLDYTFLRDRSIQTLDRDLPLVIARIREAGLAPVFVIDELDKLDDPSKTVADIIRRLKHLVSDYGFFCFLTNRSYFDKIERKVAKEAYPTEHTYFSERVLVLNRPQDLLTYVVGLATAESRADKSARFRLGIFALAVMFRSKLNFTDLSREMDRLTGTDNVLLCSDTELQSVGRFRLEATVQLAINEILMTDEVVERFRSDPGFVQLAIDTLYYIPRIWQEDSEKKVTVSKRALMAHLLGRRKEREAEGDSNGKPAGGKPADPGGKAATYAAWAAGEPAPAPAKDAEPESEAPKHGSAADRAAEAAEAKAADEEISSSDQRELVMMMERMAVYLSDFGTIRAAILARPPDPPGTPAPPIERLQLGQIVVRERSRGRLIERVGGTDSFEYEFVLDELGRPRGRRAKAARLKRSPAGKKKAAPAAKMAGTGAQAPVAPALAAPSGALLTAISNLVASVELSIDDLVRNGVLPATISESAFGVAQAAVRLARENPDDPVLVSRAWDQLLAFKEAFDVAGDQLAGTLVLLAAAGKDAGTKASPGILLPSIARYLGAPGRFDLPKNRAVPWATMKGTAESINDFRVGFKRWRANLAKSKAINAVDDAQRSARWSAWQKQVASFIRRDAGQTVKVEYPDIVMAAEGSAPGRLFRSNLGDMHQLDWSQAALAAFPAETGERPHYWLLFASLVALGFDKTRLTRLESALPPRGLPPPDESERALIQEITRHAGDRPPAVFHVFRDEAAASLAKTIPQAGPMLSVAQSALEPYQDQLEWLAENELFGEGRYDLS